MKKSLLLVPALAGLSSSAFAADFALSDLTGHVGTLTTISGAIGVLVIGFALVKVGRKWLSRAG